MDGAKPSIKGIIMFKNKEVDSLDTTGDYAITINNGELSIKFDDYEFVKNGDLNNLEFVKAWASPEFERVRSEALQIVVDYKV